MCCSIQYFLNHRWEVFSLDAPVAVGKCGFCFDIMHYTESEIQQKHMHRAVNVFSKITNPNVYLTSAHNVSFGCQQIDHFSFAFIAPLRTEHHRHFVPNVVARSLQSRRSGLIRVFVIFSRPGDRHVGGGFRLSVSRRLNPLQEWHCHICNSIAHDVRARRTVRNCVQTSSFPGC